MTSLSYVTPQLLLCFGSVFVLLAGLWIRSNVFHVIATLATLVVSAFTYFKMWGTPPKEFFGNMIVVDNFALFFALFAIMAVSLCVVLSSKSSEILADRRSEYYSILLALTTGLVFMGMSSHFLMIYLSLETVSILSYTLAGFHREKDTSVEASMKYVVYGSMASAIMIYGFSLIFGITGKVDLQGLREFVTTTPIEQIPSLLWISAILVFAGIGYKISAAPMHMWTPDVYEGAPTPVSALFSVAPKAAGFALLLRFFMTGFSIGVPGAAGATSGILGQGAQDLAVSFQVVGPLQWPKFLMYSSIFTMFMGNLAALGQTSVKRILAYSSIAHAGYILMGTTTQSVAGLEAILFYVLIYCFMNVGAFWVASKVEDATGGDDLRNFKGLVQTQPFYAVVMAVFLFSLVGLPPFAGFIGKLYLFSAIIAREMYGFALLAALNSVISLYYYVKIIKAMFLESPEFKKSELSTKGYGAWSSVVFLALLALPNIFFGLYWEPLMRVARGALTFFAR